MTHSDDDYNHAKRRQLVTRSRYYEIGYGKPPVASRFQPGQSGNPRGRPSSSPLMRSLVQQVMNGTLPIEQNGRIRRIPRKEALLLTLFSRAMKGDSKAGASLLNLALAAEAPKPGTPLSKEDIQEAYLNSLSDDELDRMTELYRQMIATAETPRSA